MCQILTEWLILIGLFVSLLSLNSNNNRLKGSSALETSVIGRQIIPDTERCKCEMCIDVRMFGW